MSDDSTPGQPMPDRVDLRPLLAHADAAEMLLLARGQLNRAFRRNGLTPPDPLPVNDGSNVGVTEMDDPAAHGIARAEARFGEAFAVWAAEMPIQLAEPVLRILRQTHAALSDQAGGDQPEGDDAARVAVLIAHDFLLDYTQPGDAAP